MSKRRTDTQSTGNDEADELVTPSQRTFERAPDRAPERAPRLSHADQETRIAELEAMVAERDRAIQALQRR